MKIILSLLLLCFSTSTYANNTKIIDDLIKKYSPSYENTKGFKAKKIQVMEISDKESGELEEKIEIKANVSSFFYDLPTQQVIAYKKDGKVEDPKDYKDRGDKTPIHPLFDKQSLEHYTFKSAGKEKYKGVEYEKFSFTPKKRKKKYIEG